MKYDRQSMVQRGHNYAIVDEVDSILVDEARTPLIISGPLEDRSEMYNTIDAFILKLEPADYEIDEKQRTAIFTEEGTEKLENLLREAGHLKGESLYDVENVAIVHHVNNALKAHRLFQKDKDYIVRNNEIVIIDEFTGRMMPGRRYSEGLHQALEAKEHVAIQPENQTLASVTFQNYFRMYKKLSGMTGTALTEAEEFGNIYGLEVTEVPTNLPVKRLDEDDEVYRTVEEKYKAIVRDIKEAREKGQPILVGTTSIEKSEQLAERLRKDGFKDFEVLNARHHEREAAIVAQAGKPGAITIATNMAGRGTDIQLGGNADMRIAEELAEMPEGPERDAKEAAIRDDVQRLKEKAIAAGGLYVLATERHESRRIDNQLQRPLRPPGRPRPFEILPVAAGRSDAHLRFRAHGRHAAEARPQGRRGDHPSVDQQGAGEGAEEGRGAQLRHPQEPPEVRRRRQRPAQGRVRAAHRPDGRRASDGNRRRDAPGRDRRPRRQAHPRERLCRAVGCRRPEGRRSRRPQSRPADRRVGQGRGHRRGRDQGAHHQPPPTPRPPTVPAVSAPR